MFRPSALGRLDLCVGRTLPDKDASSDNNACLLKFRVWGVTPDDVHASEPCCLISLS